MINIRKATPGDIFHVTQNLHPLDIQEIETVAGKKLEEALADLDPKYHDIYAVTPIWGTGTGDEKTTYEGDAVAIFGVTPDPSNYGWGIVWMLSTKMLPSTSEDIMKATPDWVIKQFDRFPHGLHNLIDSRNTRHIKWLKKMYATFDHDHVLPLGPDKVPFLHFKFE